MSNTSRQHRQNRGRMNGNVLPQSGQTNIYMPHLQQANHSVNTAKDLIGQQVMSSYIRVNLTVSLIFSIVGIFYCFFFLLIHFWFWITILSYVICDFLRPHCIILIVKIVFCILLLWFLRYLGTVTFYGRDQSNDCNSYLFFYQ